VARWKMSIDVVQAEAYDALALRDFYESVMDRLMLFDVLSPSLCGEPTTGAVAINLQLDATSIAEVVTRGMGALQRAIHASGGTTLDWPCAPDGDTMPEPADRSGPLPVRFVGTRQELIAAS
jgi:hypothetical protein